MMEMKYSGWLARSHMLAHYLYQGTSSANYTPLNVKYCSSSLKNTCKFFNQFLIMREKNYRALKRAGNLFVLFLLLLCCQQGFAQQQITVQGAIVDSAGGLPSVNISVVG